MVNIKSYMQSRIEPRLQFYDKRAIRYKYAYRGIRYTTSIMSIGILFLINLDQISSLVISLMAAIMALLVNIENISQFHDLWKSYRLTKEALEAEIQMHRYGVGPYIKARKDADALFIERTERIMSLEAKSWHSIILAGKGSSTKDSLVV